MNQSKPQEMTVDAALAQVTENLNAGRSQSALHIASQIIAQRPGHAHAHHLAGIAAFNVGDHDLMRTHLEVSLKLNPKNSGYFSNAAEMFRQVNDTARAIETAKRAVTLSANSAVPHANLGLAHYDAGNLDAAKACQSKAVALDPGHANALNNLGSIARDEGDLDLAMDYYRRASNAAPEYVEASTNLATVLIEANRYLEAQAILHDVIAKAPHRAEAHRAFAHYHLLVPDLDAAESSARNALAISGGDVDGHVLLSQVLQAKNRPDLAKLEAQKALGDAPDSHTAHHQYAICLADLGDADSARTHYEKALEIKEDYIPSILALGHLALEYGNKNKARLYFTQAQDLEPNNASPKIALTRVVKINDIKDPLLSELEAATQSVAHPPEQEAALYYALGSVYDGLQDTRAFSSFVKGAALKRQTITYDASAYEARINTLIKRMTPARIAELRTSAIDDATPIFVVGMPRSGTTLTESLLAAHSKVDGVGELPYLQKFFGADHGDVSDQYLEFPTKTLTDQARAYVAAAREQSDSAAHICDKMPANFHMVGLIHAVMPNARIIHIRRDARDTCLSMFTRLFERSQYMSYDLRELARAYKMYEKLMQHWRTVIPAGAMFEINYEDLVTDFEAEARRLLSFCQLDWEPDVLEFHASKRRVRTASVTQVRQKLYLSSVGKWRRYKDGLQPLLEELAR